MRIIGNGKPDGRGTISFTQLPGGQVKMEGKNVDMVLLLDTIRASAYEAMKLAKEQCDQDKNPKLLIEASNFIDKATNVAKMEFAKLLMDDLIETVGGGKKKKKPEQKEEDGLPMYQINLDEAEGNEFLDALKKTLSSSKKKATKPKKKKEDE